MTLKLVQSIFPYIFLREGRGTIGPRPPLKLPSQPLLNKNAAGTARHLLKNVGRALPAISFPGGPRVSPGPGQARSPGNLLISWTNKPEFHRNLKLLSYFGKNSMSHLRSDTAIQRPRQF